MYKTETDLQIPKTNMVTKEERWEREDKSGTWDQQTHTTIYITDNQQGPTVEHRELYSVLCDNHYEKRIWKRGIYV